MVKTALLGLWIIFSIIGVVLFLMIVASEVVAQEWHTANQTTIAWDISDGSTVDPPIPQDQISYYVYLVNYDTDPSKTNPTRIGTATVPTFTVTLNTHGRYLVGVSAIRTVDGEVVGESDKSWSDAANPAFGIRYFNPPPQPGGLKVQ